MCVLIETVMWVCDLHDGPFEGTASVMYAGYIRHIQFNECELSAGFCVFYLVTKMLQLKVSY